ncbi:MAG: metallophosphoesterase family protein [Gemmataceae bacterium]
MRIGIISDTHDRHEAVAEAVRLMGEQKVELILHCGDIENVETVIQFAPIRTYFVFGNWDKDKLKLNAAIRSVGGISYDAFGAIELCGKRIAWTHSHDRAKLHELETADYFDYVFYGHTHVREQHRTGKTLVANPGALFRANPKTCIVLDLETGELKPIILPLPPKSAESIYGIAGLDSTHQMPGLPPFPPKPGT